MKKCPFCAEEIQDEAIVCRYCNRDLDQPASKPLESSAQPPRKPITPEAVLIIIVVVLVMLGGLKSSNVFTPKPKSEPERVVLPQAPFQETLVVTRAEYDSLREGMSYSEAVSIIGASGDELSRSDLAGISTVMYSWVNTNGSNMNAMFQNDKLITKAQFGLP